MNSVPLPNEPNNGTGRATLCTEDRRQRGRRCGTYNVADWVTINTIEGWASVRVWRMGQTLERCNTRTGTHHLSRPWHTPLGCVDIWCDARVPVWPQTTTTTTTHDKLVGKYSRSDDTRSIDASLRWPMSRRSKNNKPLMTLTIALPLNAWFALSLSLSL